MEKRPREMTKTFFPDTYEKPGQKRLVGIVRACKGNLWSKGHNFRAINNLSTKENVSEFEHFYQKIAKSQVRLRPGSFKN